MAFDELAIILVRGFGQGAIYALIAMSMNVIFGATQILNFAQGSFFVLGGFLAFFSSNMLLGIPMWAAAIPLAALVIAALMAAQGWITLLPLRHSVEQHSWLITTFAVSIMLSALMLIFRGPWASTVNSLLPSFSVFGVRTPGTYAAIIVLMFAWYFALRWFLNKTLPGLAISALSQDLEAASAAGLRVKRLQLLSFAISGLIVGSAGFISAPVISISADTGIRYVLNAFIASVVGGMGSNLGAIIGGPLVGMIAALATYEIGGEYQSFVSMILLVAVLLLRPQGFFGRAAARRV